mmetsp:Transcript_14480/g.25353  ORF Transcript_14480/g.25353 Transcript_14480/m.25353 type:complete len:239 (-) Transcript_14480:11-727(-)
MLPFFGRRSSTNCTARSAFSAFWSASLAIDSVSTRAFDAPGSVPASPATGRRSWLRPPVSATPSVDNASASWASATLCFIALVIEFATELPVTAPLSISTSTNPEATSGTYWRQLPGSPASSSGTSVSRRVERQRLPCQVMSSLLVVSTKLIPVADPPEMGALRGPETRNVEVGNARDKSPNVTMPRLGIMVLMKTAGRRRVRGGSTVQGVPQTWHICVLTILAQISESLRQSDDRAS